MNILKSLGGWLFRVVASILASVALVVAIAIGLPFMILAILAAGIFAPADWFTNISQEVDPNLNIDGDLITD